ncbi:phage tail protein [Salmonella enterica]|uniref:phage tail protein n=1 Tax=Salmonella enterica TaxID=28901 RepID=UPI0021B6B7C9|nr:phage tail protein [Salmonella enterica]UXC42815.1 phage tail protein [Salmonella enterica]
MATNNFKAFALDPNANVTSQADWEALPALLSGFTAGKASSAQVNKAIRQATTIAALVGQFIANSGADALDNADVNGLVTKFTNALISNLRLGAGAPAIGIPFFWPSSAMPNTVMTEWADMVFLKFNGATFSASTYPKLALVFPGLILTEARGEFLRIWDDGRGVDSGRTIMSSQSEQFKEHVHSIFVGYAQGGPTPSGGNYRVSATNNDGEGPFADRMVSAGGNETRPRNIAFNFLVRAK